MNCAVKFDELLKQERLDTEQAMTFFDELEPVDVAFMLGNWRGDGLATGHKMDGLMEHYNWYGKSFESSERVHPLVFERFSGKRVRLNPIFFPLKFAARSRLSMSGLARRVFNLATYFVNTRHSKARLRMTEYRGKVSATMVYDQLPINDVFRKIDDNKVLGVMDLKDASRPFFFILTRDR